MWDSSRIHLACVVGARPNFMKMAPLMRALEVYPRVRLVLIHTGQHYDESLSDVFFDELGIRRPDVSLEVGSGTHAEQTARLPTTHLRDAQPHSGIGASPAWFVL